MGDGYRQIFRFASAKETAGFAASLAPRLGAGDSVLLQGGLGAGKTHFARSLIQARLAAGDRHEDVPSPTYTLVQTYFDGALEIWHADLYRLVDLDEVFELGLEEAFETGICLIEWPQRLGTLAPPNALTLTFEMTETPAERVMTATGASRAWADLLARCETGQADG